MKVPFGNLQRDENETMVAGEPLQERIRRNVHDVMERRNFILGDYVQKFEEAFAAYCGVKYCIGVSNGLSALELSLISLGVGPGDEVITVANTFNATAAAILKTGARPVIVDARESDFNIDPDQVKKAITPNTKAIIPVHLYGQTVDMDELMQEAQGIPIIEDACQAHGARYKGKRAGSMGVAGCFSFYPGKNLGAYGDGGAVVTDSDKIADFLRKTRNYGQTKKYFHDARPDNSRLDTIQAAVLIEKLKVLDQWNAQRRAHAETYRKELGHVPEVELPSERRSGEHIYHLFVIKTDRRAELEEDLKQEGVDTGLHYPVPIHLQPCFSQLGYKKGDFPVAERLADRILTLPMFPTMKQEEIKYVADSIKEYFS